MTYILMKGVSDTDIVVHTHGAPCTSVVPWARRSSHATMAGSMKVDFLYVSAFGLLANFSSSMKYSIDFSGAWAAVHKSPVASIQSCSLCLAALAALPLPSLIGHKLFLPRMYSFKPLMYTGIAIYKSSLTGCSGSDIVLAYRTQLRVFGRRYGEYR